MATECVNRLWARSIGESITCEAFKITKQILYFLIQSTAMNHPSLHVSLRMYVSIEDK